jgi:hypothetical protein
MARFAVGLSLVVAATLVAALNAQTLPPDEF